MATRDQALFLETYIGLKRALKRKSFDSDSDSDIDQSTNRGNKLKRRARFVREGQLGAADGSSIFTEVVEHAGYRREILSRNPPLVDDDGYEIESEEDDDAIQEAAVAAAAEKDPYSGIHLEQILAPLTSVTDLPSHPTLSRPFTSKALSELATQGFHWMQKENNALWKVKPLFTKFCGDHNWVDCALMLTPDDVNLFDDDFTARLAALSRATNGTNGAKSNGTGQHAGGLIQDKNSTDADTEMQKEEGLVTSTGDTDAVRGSGVDGDKSQTEESGLTGQNGQENGVDNDGDDDNDDSDGDKGDNVADNYIHPLFLAPRTAHPESNAGLPDAEAEDVRRLLQLWVQKQEEVARGIHKLHEGLLRADRLRKTVLLWSKAEANRDLSDGEDYYDRDTWGLTEDLKKGYDEEEEDLQQPHKKTRNRK